MNTLPKLFENNRRWAERIHSSDPSFFEKLSHQQSPQYLWIGCADSRVPANEITGMLPGELFVHRNLANLVVHSDMNCLSVLQYALDILNIRHVIVCGHYGCGGVRAALENRCSGLVDDWLHPIRELDRRHREELGRLKAGPARTNRLCELNVMQQVINVGNTNPVQAAWSKAQPVVLHGWIYAISDGVLKDLAISVSSAAELEALETA